MIQVTAGFFILAHKTNPEGNEFYWKCRVEELDVC